MNGSLDHSASGRWPQIGMAAWVAAAAVLVAVAAAAMVMPASWQAQAPLEHAAAVGGIALVWRGLLYPAVSRFFGAPKGGLALIDPSGATGAIRICWWLVAGIGVAAVAAPEDTLPIAARMTALAPLGVVAAGYFMRMLSARPTPR